MTHWGSDSLSSWHLTCTRVCSFWSCACARVQSLSWWYIDDSMSRDSLSWWYIDDTLSSWLVEFVTYCIYRGVQLLELWMCEGRNIELTIFRWHIQFVTHWVDDIYMILWVHDPLGSWLIEFMVYRWHFDFVIHLSLWLTELVIFKWHIEVVTG